MAMSKIEICNLAFARLGADFIRSFDENNKRARMADVFFEPVKQHLLTKIDWPFAKKFSALQQLVGVEVPEGFYAYALPSDNLVVRYVHPRELKVSWTLQGNALVCQLSENVQVYYTANITDTSKLSQSFAMLLSLALAVHMCLPITQDKKLYDALASLLRSDMYDAWETDANIGNEYRHVYEDPKNDTFVFPDGYVVDEG